ncbi:protein NRT1/ PTR FAMILY 5.13-like [Chenopodium quinoa]|uniref:protein NRT1/ PTR FAMILY 5.13-like n=1 Tax=Chenopodium quinoa TaxID=63459 RepID=UPI000B799208|nr:protein NRT1/ PTR FAMILY 5.13-like [Chenopodium quinoa]
MAVVEEKEMPTTGDVEISEVTNYANQAGVEDEQQSIVVTEALELEQRTISCMDQAVVDVLEEEPPIIPVAEEEPEEEEEQKEVVLVEDKEEVAVKVEEEDEKKDLITRASDGSEESSSEVLALEAAEVKRRKLGERILLQGVDMCYSLANYQFMALITLLTDSDYWSINLFHAVIITNINEGAKPLLVILTAWLADTYLGDCWTLIISAFSYVIGMLMWFLALRYLANGNLDIIFKGLFTAGLLLILFGQCGYENYTKDNIKFVLELKINQEDGKDQSVSSYKLNKALKTLRLLFFQRYWIIVIFFGIAILMDYLIHDIKLELLIVFIMLGVTVLFNLGKQYSYICSCKEPMGSPLSAIFNVLLVAFKKKNDNSGTLEYTAGANRENGANAHQKLTNRYRCLNRAAKYDPSLENIELEFEKRKLCTVQQVEDTKLFIGCICLSWVFLMYGVMTATGDTFFNEQIYDMKPEIGKFKVPIQIFVFISDAIRELVSSIWQWILANKDEATQKRFHGTLRVGLGMMLSVPCFVIAYIVEAKSLKKRKQTDETISVLWLTHQLILIGIMDGLVGNGIDCFFKQEMPGSIAGPYGSMLGKSIVGTGKLLGIGWFCFWYYVTGGNKHGWFGQDITQSHHLDYYYATMAAFGFVSFVVYVLVALVNSLTHKRLLQERSSDDVQSIHLPSRKLSKLQVSESLRLRTSANRSSSVTD